MRAIYAGSFDPITYGHLWVIRQSLDLFDKVVVAIGENPAKRCMFSLDERWQLINDSLPADPTNQIRISEYRGKYLVDAAAALDCDWIIRGIRDSSDFRFERSLQRINQQIDPHPKTMYLIPPAELAEVSSSIVKSMVGFDGWENAVAKLVPTPVLEALKGRS